ncbi:MAG: M1 family metallopeptidase [Saprospiraceae bacterium]|nr:M1 family metallopeptidase [Saprospiraceae bacterium]
MKGQFWSIIIVLCLVQNVFGQKAYFQQKVNTKIDVRLDDIKHTLQGDCQINYFNNSPDTLRFLYFNLWPNAYKHHSTRFAAQQIRNGQTDFYFSKEKEKGFLKDVDFQVDGKSLRYLEVNGSPDMVKVMLENPILPNQSITITTPLKLKIPNSFSRLGHVDNSYQITQWYPKPAVYDHKGWHPMPYLDQGEFYSEFGDFEVSITLPTNYVVGATGELITDSEKAFINAKIVETEHLFLQNDSALYSKIVPISSPEFKTITYKAQNVHDFAWFADKQFFIQKSKVNLASGRTVDTYTLFTPTDLKYWKKSIQYIDQAVLFYSEKVGEYPYPQATAVQSALSAGGGMEYPMITVIGRVGSGKSLDEVIAHEVGHNWFYGILASNEREHAWMDEGLNSYIEKLYMQKYYPDTDKKEKEFDIAKIGIDYFGLKKMLQAPDTHSEKMTNYNYGFSSYTLPSNYLLHWRAQVGEELADKTMRHYFDEWKFKHPYPSDLKSSFESVENQNLTWLFDGLIAKNKKPDYFIKNIAKNQDHTDITIANKGDVDLAMPISMYKNDQKILTRWTSGKSEEVISFTGTDYTKVVIDPDNTSPDLSPRNNYSLSTDKIDNHKKMSFKLGAGFVKPDENRLNFLPILSYNSYDKFSLGVLLHNVNLPIRNFEFQLMPMFGFGSKDLIGTANAIYHKYMEQGFLSRIDFKLNFRKYNEFNSEVEGIDKLGYWRAIPEIQFNIRSKPTSSFYQNISVRGIYLSKEGINFDSTGNTIESNNRFVKQLTYSLGEKKVINPYSVKFVLEQQDYKTFSGNKENYLKLDMEAKFAFHYMKNKKFDVRLFGGYFIKNTQQSNLSFSDELNRGYYSLLGNGSVDYYKEFALMGRNDYQGIFGQQNVEIMGGFKNRFEYDRSFLNSSYYILAFNAKLDLPQTGKFFPLKPYVDLGYAQNPSYDPEQDIEGFESPFSYTAGVMLDYMDGLFSVQFPIFYSKNINRVYREENGGNRGLNKYEKQITFTLNLNKLNIFNYTHKIETVLPYLIN